MKIASNFSGSYVAILLRIIVKLFCCLYCYNCSYANTATADLANLLANIATLKANFIQTIIDDNRQTLQQSQGTMYLLKSGSLRWEVSQPIHQIFVVHQQLVWLYDPELQQVIIKPLHALDVPVLLLTKQLTTLVSNNFFLDKVYKKNHYLWYRLKAKTANSQYHLMELGFFNHKLHAMCFHDNLGHKITIKLQHVSYNVAIKPTIFNLKLPANIDIIDER
jgi:outer membrane lipoprotein carrier protein